MSSTPPALPADVQALVDQKKFDALETLWTRRVEEGGSDMPFFFALAAAVKKKGGGAQAVAWLRLLAEFHGSEDGEAGARRDAEAAVHRPPGALGRARPVLGREGPGPLGRRRKDRALAVVSP